MSNFVFSRRTLQGVIERLADSLTSEQLSALVERLNRAGDQRLPAMWEAVMLDVLATEGSLRHEVTLKNGRRPDFELEVGGPEGSSLLVVGDVVTVSDAGLDKQNPVDLLSEELTRVARRYGLNPNHFGYDVDGIRRGSYGNARVKLFLPSRKDLLDVVKQKVEPWIKELAVSKLATDSLEYSHGEAKFSLKYNTSQPFQSGSYLSYNVAASRNKNPLFGALKTKVKQLRAAPPDALRLLIVCDGDCALLSSFSQAPDTFDASEVANDFLRQNSTVDFVLIVTVIDQRKEWSSLERVSRNKFNLVVAPPGSRSERATDAVITKMRSLSERVVAQVPQPIRTPKNALYRCRIPGPGPDMIGGYKLGDNHISISSRALQRLLAGEINQYEYLEAHGWPEERPNPFKRMISEGRMIQSVNVIDSGKHDDDWLEFNFGAPDPAAGPFRIPEIADREDKTN